MGKIPNFPCPLCDWKGPRSDLNGHIRSKHNSQGQGLQSMQGNNASTDGSNPWVNGFWPQGGNWVEKFMGNPMWMVSTNLGNEQPDWTEFANQMSKRGGMSGMSGIKNESQSGSQNTTQDWKEFERKMIEMGKEIEAKYGQQSYTQDQRQDWNEFERESDEMSEISGNEDEGEASSSENKAGSVEKRKG